MCRKDVSYGMLCFFLCFQKPSRNAQLRSILALRGLTRSRSLGMFLFFLRISKLNRDLHFVNGQALAKDTAEVTRILENL